MTLQRVSNWFEGLALPAVAVFVVMLFVNSPTAPPPATAEAVAAAGGIDGSALYAGSCSGCHGGDGSGGIGPRLAGRVVAHFPDPAAQAAVIADGHGSMPAFGTRLTNEEIATIVEFTRTVLGGD